MTTATADVETRLHAAQGRLAVLEGMTWRDNRGGNWSSRDAEERERQEEMATLREEIVRRLPPGHVRAYDPATSRDWKRTIQAQVLPARPNGLLAGPLPLTLAFELPRPKSLPKKVRHHTKRPDVDNLVKAVKDALRGIVYADDAQIVRLEARKGYGDAPGVLIELAVLEDAA